MFATDDPANQMNVEMISVFPQASSERLKLEPSEFGMKEIGHMSFRAHLRPGRWSQIFSKMVENKSVMLYKRPFFGESNDY